MAGMWADMARKYKHLKSIQIQKLKKNLPTQQANTWTVECSGPIVWHNCGHMVFDK